MIYVVIPVLKGRYLQDTLNSIFNSSMRLQPVVVLDGPDAFPGIEYGLFRSLTPVVLRSRHNVGTYVAKNSAVKWIVENGGTRDDYVLFLDADDTLETSTAEALYLRHKSSGPVCGVTLEVTVQGVPIPDRRSRRATGLLFMTIGEFVDAGGYRPWRTAADLDLCDFLGVVTEHDAVIHRKNHPEQNTRTNIGIGSVTSEYTKLWARSNRDFPRSMVCVELDREERETGYVVGIKGIDFCRRRKEIDALSTVYDLVYWPGSDLRHLQGYNLKGGEIGCWVSHLRLWRRILETHKTGEWVYVFEDDVIPHGDWKPWVQKFHPSTSESWFVWMGSSYTQPAEGGTGWFPCDKRTCGTFAYAVRVGKELAGMVERASKMDRVPPSGLILYNKKGGTDVPSPEYTFNLPVDNWLAHQLKGEGKYLHPRAFIADVSTSTIRPPREAQEHFKRAGWEEVPPITKEALEDGVWLQICEGGTIRYEPCSTPQFLTVELCSTLPFNNIQHRGWNKVPRRGSEGWNNPLSCTRTGGRFVFGVPPSEIPEEDAAHKRMVDISRHLDLKPKPQASIENCIGVSYRRVEQFSRYEDSPNVVRFLYEYPDYYPEYVKFKRTNPQATILSIRRGKDPRVYATAEKSTSARHFLFVSEYSST